ncbi:MAG: hypothetical protein KC546_11690 [Anaerolineae bacterium]|nr:hypothetical protein [Anaerolineae bacterium]MCA9889030.1 hypothetical protein [Anaerolineae bacterium]MCA9892311.1 hypothetical protein [Anaerolineae bacterium]MCB9458924.1 hypothetical protein [Anaerolineaceae bacterium]
MAYLNKQERDNLLDSIKNLKFNRIKGKLRHMDAKNRLIYYRNVQESGRWLTAYELPTLGVKVTLVENMELGRKNKAEYDLEEIIIEPTKENRL